MFTIFDISSQLLQSKGRANGRKCVSNRDKHFLSLSQNAKIDFKALTEAQSHSIQLQNFKTHDHSKSISRQARETIGRAEDSTEATTRSAQD
jgi:hypothetical protein